MTVEQECQKWIKDELAAMPPNAAEAVKDFHMLLASPTERTTFFQMLTAMRVYLVADGKDAHKSTDQAIEQVIAALALLVVIGKNVRGK